MATRVGLDDLTPPQLAAARFLIALTVGADLTLMGFVLTLGSAISWAVGNLLLKRLPPVPTLGLMVWLSLVPPAPALVLALALGGPLPWPRQAAA